MDHIRIVADDRERKSGIPQLLREIGINLEIKTLPVGDYIVAPETVIERKSVRDLVSSIFDGRLFEQCSKLREHFERPAILVEGNLDELEEITENPMIFYGAVSTAVMEFGIPVMPTPSAVHTAKLLIAMAARKRNGMGGPYIKKIRKSEDVQRQQLSILCSLPGVGETFATRMLEKFGTPMGALSATKSELLKVEGMGESRAERIRSVLNADAAGEKSGRAGGGGQTRLEDPAPE